MRTSFLPFAPRLKSLFSWAETEPSEHSQPQASAARLGGGGGATPGDSQQLAFAETTLGAEVAYEAIDELGVGETRYASREPDAPLKRSSSDPDMATTTCLSCMPRMRRKSSRASRAPLNPVAGAGANVSSNTSLDARTAFTRSTPTPIADNQTTVSTDSSAATASRACASLYPPVGLDSGLATANSSLAPSLTQSNSTPSASAAQIASAGDEPDAQQFWTRLLS